jgi:hypothetical protein
MKPFKKDFMNYNWLITDYETNIYRDENTKFEDEYVWAEETVWINGKRLYEILETYEIQFLWAVFSGFNQNISYEEIMQHEPPKSESYDHWGNKTDTQNPLADIEIVAWDSACVIFKSKNEDYIKRFKECFLLSGEVQ